MDWFLYDGNLRHERVKTHAFFISNTFISNARLKLAENQANAKQHSDTEPLLFQNCKFFIHTEKIIRHILKSKQKNKCVCVNEIIQLVIMKINIKMKNRS